MHRTSYGTGTHVSALPLCFVHGGAAVSAAVLQHVHRAEVLSRTTITGWRPMVVVTKIAGLR